LSLSSLDPFNVFLEKFRTIPIRKNNILSSLDFQNVQNNRKEKEMGHESHVDRNHKFYAPVACCGSRIFQYLWPTMDTFKTMKKLIYTLVGMLMLSAVSIPFAAARDQNRDALRHKLTQQQRQQQRWEAVMNSTGAARQEALKTYQYHLHDLWDPPP
jgi:hypothetical protein